MKALRIASGVAVLLMALHFIHLVQHFFAENPLHGLAFAGALAAAIVIDGLTFVGGVLLLKG